MKYDGIERGAPYVHKYFASTKCAPLQPVCMAILGYSVYIDTKYGLFLWARPSKKIKKEREREINCIKLYRSGSDF